MKVILIQVLLPLATYFIGVFIGRRSVLKYIYVLEDDDQAELTEQDEIQHVGYTPEQCGYDK